MKNLLIKKIALSLCLFVALVVTGQDKLLTIEEIFTNSKLYPSSLKQLQWIGNSSKIFYIKNENMFYRDINSSDTLTFLTLDNFNKRLVESGEKEANRFPELEWLSSCCFMFT